MRSHSSIFSYREGGKFVLAALLLVMAIVVLPVSADANRFVNPGFETGDLTGWTQVESPVNSGITSSIVHSGSYSIQMGLGTITTDPLIEQEIDLTDVKAISFWHYLASTKQAGLRLIIDDTEVWTTSTIARNKWQQITVPISEYSGVHKVTIKFWTGFKTYSDYIDDIAAIPSPNASFSAIPETGTAPLSVQFTDASTGSPDAWAWDFQNDGTVDSTEASPQFTYNDPGTYTVSLMVTNSAGSDTEVKDKYITVEKGTAAPEFPAAFLPAAMIIGLLGTVLFIRRTQEN